MEFCNPFDETLARRGPAAVFLRDDEGRWKFAPNWTRDAWERSSGPHDDAWRWGLLRDRATGFVQFVLVTSSTLLQSHPRSDVRLFGSQGEAREALASYGHPPLCEEPW